MNLLTQGILTSYDRPFAAHNMPISDDRLDRLQRNIAYQFKDSNLLRLALTHRSFGKPNNERLEFLGDAVLGAIVADALYKQNAIAQEGELTQHRSSLVNGKNLAAIARRLQLDEVLLLGQGEKRDQLSDAILEDALEALVGAVFIDSSFDTATKAFAPIVQRQLADITSVGSTKDSKTRLQELMQAKKAALPRYRLEYTEGPDHDRRFVVRVHISAPQLDAVGEGSSRKNAEQQAANKLLNMLEQASTEDG